MGPGAPGGFIIPGALPGNEQQPTTSGVTLSDPSEIPGKKKKKTMYHTLCR